MIWNTVTAVCMLMVAVLAMASAIHTWRRVPYFIQFWQTSSAVWHFALAWRFWRLSTVIEQPLPGMALFYALTYAFCIPLWIYTIMHAPVGLTDKTGQRGDGGVSV